MDNKHEIKKEIKRLENTLTGNLMDDMDTRNTIHQLTMKLNKTTPRNTEIECIGCGS